MTKSLFAEFTALPGHEERVAFLVQGLTEKVRQEPGNIVFLPFTREEHPRRWFVFEQYVDDAAFEAHINADYGAQFNAELAHHIVEEASELTWLDSADDERFTAADV